MQDTTLENVLNNLNTMQIVSGAGHNDDGTCFVAIKNEKNKARQKSEILSRLRGAGYRLSFYNRFTFTWTIKPILK